MMSAYRTAVQARSALASHVGALATMIAVLCTAAVSVPVAIHPPERNRRCVLLSDD